jgi:anti-sigma factor (TIGR02949 family)
MMISCQEVVTELWDYLDGELPPERATAIAEHLAECARCYPQYRFEYAFLSAVARQRAQGPGPTPALVERVAGAVLAAPPGTARPPHPPARPAPEQRRPTPRAAAPIPPRGPVMGSRAGTERWALVVLRASLGVFLSLEVVRLAVTGAAALSPTVLSVVATLEGLLATLVVLGAWRRWSYGAALLAHLGSLLILWGQLRDPWGAALAGLPACGALVTLYLLRDRDAWALDSWFAMRRPWRVMR